MSAKDNEAIVARQLEAFNQRDFSGTSTLGGVGGVLGTLIGCILLGVINNSLILLSGPGPAQFWQRAVYGFIILGAVVVDALISQRLQKALRRRHV